MKRTNYCNGFCGNGGRVLEYSNIELSNSRKQGVRVLEQSNIELSNSRKQGVSNTRALELSKVEFFGFAKKIYKGKRGGYAITVDLRARRSGQDDALS